MSRRKEVWSKCLVRLVQDSFRIGSDLNESHWFRIGSGIVPCLQGTDLRPRYCLTLRKKWSQKGSTPGAVSWYVTQLHPWHYFGAPFPVYRYPKKRLHPPKWHRFPKRFQDGAVLAPLFSQCFVQKVHCGNWGACGTLLLLDAF